MVGRGNGSLGPTHLATGHAQAVKRLGTGDLVNQLQVNIQNRLPTLFLENDVIVPNLLKERSWLHSWIKCILAKVAPAFAEAWKTNISFYSAS